MNIGVIGAKSKHLRFFQKALEALPGNADAKISAVCCCDGPELRPALQDLIIFDTPEALIRASDAVIIALRDGTQHAALAKFCVDAGKPVFVDKPFTCDIDEAEQLCAYAERGIVTGSSTLSMTPIVRSLAGSLPPCSHYTLSYMADPFSPYGGWYFYGSHLAELCVTILGGHFCGTEARQTGDHIDAVIQYPTFTVTLRSSPGLQLPLLTADRVYTLDDQDCYLYGMEHFLNVIAGKEKGRTGQCLASVRLLDQIFAALRRSTSGKG